MYFDVEPTLLYPFNFIDQSEDYKWKYFRNLLSDSFPRPNSRQFNIKYQVRRLLSVFSLSPPPPSFSISKLSPISTTATGEQLKVVSTQQSHTRHWYSLFTPPAQYYLPLLHFSTEQENNVPISQTIVTKNSPGSRIKLCHPSIHLHIKHTLHLIDGRVTVVDVGVASQFNVDKIIRERSVAGKSPVNWFPPPIRLRSIIIGKWSTSDVNQIDSFSGRRSISTTHIPTYPADHTITGVG